MGGTKGVTAGQKFLFTTTCVILTALPAQAVCYGAYANWHNRQSRDGERTHEDVKAIRGDESNPYADLPQSREKRIQRNFERLTSNSPGSLNQALMKGNPSLQFTGQNVLFVYDSITGEIIDFIGLADLANNVGPRGNTQSQRIGWVTVEFEITAEGGRTTISQVGSIGSHSIPSTIQDAIITFNRSIPAIQQGGLRPQDPNTVDPSVPSQPGIPTNAGSQNNNPGGNPRRH